MWLEVATGGDTHSQVTEMSQHILFPHGESATDSTVEQYIIYFQDSLF